ncbi:kynurenine--oxoglutarate transaminase 3-like [Contarinia nasturtii]|uniref:kynurenine--oxoglutarate transaminase 3-like n=1 Tax=Contarinia nasturtii TaxID=265458 RepID=UPI0012D38865|nr:kynurenine--oxoglutarate transaminase 3-like [Contarinia nasturtii]XP_031631271.1 kynurenine--oxoglutarate transaminase 3-like [Contarinia nasturtii]XP_031631272.1 kynurenine--oxoglutarate transaminase 3-like [Contarinia nasturtii]
MSCQSIDAKFQLPQRYQGQIQSFWDEYIQLTLKYKPMNLGLGFTDGPVPQYITDALAAAAKSPNSIVNQYTRGSGHPRLIQALSTLYSQLVDRKIDPINEMLITIGAYEALYATIQGHVDEGDEVIIIEPFFECYEPMVKICGGVPRFIPLRLNNTTTSSNSEINSSDYVLDDGELEGLFNEKTKMIILNTPNNPLGKVFSRIELTKIAELCQKYNVLCVSDEVYEWMIFDDNKHIRICTLPGMWERTITIGSAGKTFSVTGWKTGWAYGPANLIINLKMVHQNCVYNCPTPIQEAIAIIFEGEIKRLDSPACYFNVLAAELKKKRDFMAEFLNENGMKPIIPQGGFFMTANWSALENKADLSTELDTQQDFRFTKWMIKNVGVLAMPPSAFFSDTNKSMMEHFVRYCFFKTDENLQTAANILKEWTGKVMTIRQNCLPAPPNDSI